MKKQTLYVCEFCNTQYKNEKDAVICESNHHTPKKIGKSYYHSAKHTKDGYPDKIEITFDDGEVIKYSR